MIRLRPQIANRSRATEFRGKQIVHFIGIQPRIDNPTGFENLLLNPRRNVLLKIRRANPGSNSAGIFHASATKAAKNPPTAPAAARVAGNRRHLRVQLPFNLNPAVDQGMQG